MLSENDSLCITAPTTRNVFVSVLLCPGFVTSVQVSEYALANTPAQQAYPSTKIPSTCCSSGPSKPNARLLVNAVLVLVT